MPLARFDCKAVCVYWGPVTAYATSCWMDSCFGYNRRPFSVVEASRVRYCTAWSNVMMSFAAGYAWPYIRQKALQPITITESPTEAAMTARLARMCVHSRVLAACMCVRHMPQCGDHMMDDTYCLEVIQVRIQVHSQTLRWGSRVCTWWCSM